VQKKNVIALGIMALLLMVLAPIAIIAIIDTPSCSDLHGVLASVPPALPQSIEVYYHYYGWPDGISVIVVHQVSGKQLGPGAIGDVWGSYSSVSGGISRSSSFLREHYTMRVNPTFKVAIRSSGERRDVEVEVDHQFDSSDKQLAWMVIQGADYFVTSDTVFLIEQQLDGSSTVKKLDYDLSELLGESEHGNARFRGTPDKAQLETFLLESPVLEELKIADDQGQKSG